MKRFGSVLARAAVAYYGVMIVAYLAKEAKGHQLGRTIAGTLTAYYTVMGLLYLSQEASGKANEESGGLLHQ